MDKLSFYIEKLLTQHDYVVVPGFGGFVVQMQSALITEDKIVPPLATVGFNSLLNNADGMLAIEMARSEKISYRAAVELIEKSVEDLKYTLSHSGNYQIGNLGYLHQETEGTVFFQPAADTGFIPVNFTLSELSNTSRYRFKAATTKVSGSDIKSIHHSFKYAAAAAMLAGLLLIPGKINDNRNNNYAGMSTLITNILPEAKTASQPDDSVQVVATSNASEKKFHVVVASVQTEKKACEIRDKLLHENFREAHVIEPRKIYRVAVQSFASKDSAVSYMNQLRRDNKEFSQAWVMTK